MKSRWVRQLFDKRRGFSLVELSVLLLVIGLAMSTILSVKSGEVDRTARVKSTSHMDEIIAAMQTYLNNNSHYPCPASRTVLPATATFGRAVLADCVTDTSTPAGTLRYETAASSGVYIREGVVPIRDLLLPDSYMSDEYGNRYTYVVMESLTAAASYSAGTAVLIVKDAAGADIATDAAYLVISHGKDGKGAYRDGSGALKIACGATTNLDVENCDNDATFRNADYNESTTAALYYDDLAHYEPKGTIGATSSPSPPPLPSPDFTGFRLDGNSGLSEDGSGVATGDINGDGFEDVIMGFQQFNNIGAVYVVFSSSVGFDSPFDLSTLDGTTGFRLDGIASADYTGNSVSSGDINNDGFDDVIIGAPYADIGGDSTGSTYVVFGKAGAWAATTALSTLNGTTGFRLDGFVANGNAGFSVSSGDINNDGFDDVIIGNSAGYERHIHVVFGKASGWAATTVMSTTNLGLNATGFRLDATHYSLDWAGWSVSSGDINGDGFDDVIIGVRRNGSSVGYVYVVFGKATAWNPTTALDTIIAGGDPSITGVTYTVSAQYSNFTGYQVEAQMRDNGYTSADSVAFTTSAAGSWIKADFGSTRNITAIKLGPYNSWGASYTNNKNLDCSTDGSSWSTITTTSGHANSTTKTYTVNVNCRYIRLAIVGTDYVGAGEFWFEGPPTPAGGFRLEGEYASGLSAGQSVASGDINNDGFDDVIIGAADFGSRPGSIFVVFGKASGWANMIMNTTNLNGTTGFRLDGLANGDKTGHSVSSGDVNGDGFDDVIIGANRTPSYRGSTYVVFGKASGWAATMIMNTTNLNGTTGFRLDGSVDWGTSGARVYSGNITGDAYDDLLIVGARSGGNASTYGIYGKASGWSATYDLDTITVPP